MQTPTRAVFAAVERAAKTGVIWPQDDETAAHLMTAAVPADGSIRDARAARRGDGPGDGEL